MLISEIMDPRITSIGNQIKTLMAQKKSLQVVIAQKRALLSQIRTQNANNRAAKAALKITG
jgi:hypothetical protein